MLSVQTAHSLISLITFVLAYLVSVTLAGFFRAWVATKLGDDTAQSLGFLTLNPLAHIDFIGMAMIIFLRFGWGRFVPINPLNFRGFWAPVKLAVAFLSDTVAHLGMASTGFALMILMLGPRVFITDQILTQAYPDASSFTLALSFIMASVVFLNVMLAVISFILSACGIVVMFAVERHPDYAQYSDIVMIVVPVFLLFLFAGPLYMMVIWLISSIGTFLATLLHAN